MNDPRDRERQPLRKSAVLVGIALATAGCAPLRTPVVESAAPAPSLAPSPAADSVPSDPGALRDWARELARLHCGACHIASRPTAKPAALVIYNLDAPEWLATLSPERLRGGFTRRLNGRLDEADQQRLRAFVESEIASRGK